MSATDPPLIEIPDQRIPLPGGLTLSARIWRPAGGDPVPAILEALPYRKRDFTALRDATMHPRMAAAGYACVRLDLRGSGQSDGIFDDEYSPTELGDIETAIAWIADQTWCSGKIGMQGISWGGFNGLQVAARRPPGLAAVISLASTVDRFADDIHYKGGCQLTENIGWAATAMSWLSMPPDPAQIGPDGPDWRAVWRDRLENMPFLASIWTRANTRDAYWKHGSVAEDFSAIEIPVLAIAGWHDGYRNTPVKLLEGLPEAVRAGRVKALIGPWNHKYPHLASPGPQLDYVPMALRWWDHWLKGIDTGVDRDPALGAYVMDPVPPRTRYDARPGTWVGLADWPAPQITQKVLTLGPDGLGQGAGGFARTVPSDPRHGEASGEFFPFGFGPGELPADQRADDARAACFDSAPLTADLTLLGAAQVTLSLSADRPRAQLVARLSDVAPDGAATLISFGLLNLAFRDGFETAKPLTPGQSVDVIVPLDHAGYRVPRGHRLRLSLGASYWPFAWPEADNPTLSVTAGALSLPVLTGDTGPVPLPGPPQPTPPAHVRHTDGTEAKTWTTEGTTRVLRITADHGSLRDIDHGLIHGSALSEVWTIDAQDTTSPQAEIIWDRHTAREGTEADFRAATRVETRMTATARHWVIDMRLTAWDGDDQIHDAHFHDKIPR